MNGNPIVLFKFTKPSRATKFGQAVTDEPVLGYLRLNVTSRLETFYPPPPQGKVFIAADGWITAQQIIGDRMIFQNMETGRTTEINLPSGLHSNDPDIKNPL